MLKREFKCKDRGGVKHFPDFILHSKIWPNVYALQNLLLPLKLSWAELHCSYWSLIRIQLWRKQSWKCPENVLMLLCVLLTLLLPLPLIKPFKIISIWYGCFKVYFVVIYFYWLQVLYFWLGVTLVLSKYIDVTGILFPANSTWRASVCSPPRSSRVTWVCA